MRVRLRVEASGKPARAEVELGIVEETVCALAPDTSIDIREFFYYRWRRGAFYEGGEDARLKQLTEGDLDVLWGVWDGPALEPLPPALYWNGRVLTDEEGRAEIEVAAPDRPATWRVIARAVSGTDRFGWGATAFRMRGGESDASGAGQKPAGDSSR
jgi:uncharacterized protein YfaS (alpha-2-macroglobulin family)